MQDYIEEALIYAATGIKKSEVPVNLYEAVDHLKQEKTADKFLTWYCNTVEFVRAKQQRSTQHQTTQTVSLDY